MNKFSKGASLYFQINQLITVFRFQTNCKHGNNCIDNHDYLTNIWSVTKWSFVVENHQPLLSCNAEISFSHHPLRQSQSHISLVHTVHLEPHGLSFPLSARARPQTLQALGHRLGAGSDAGHLPWCQQHPEGTNELEVAQGSWQCFEQSWNRISILVQFFWYF